MTDVLPRAKSSFSETPPLAYSRIFKDIQGFSRTFKDFSRIFKDIQGFSKIFKEVKDFQSFFKDIRGFLRILKDFQGFSTTAPIYVIEVASVKNRKGLARAGSWFMKSFIFYQIYLPAIDTIVT